MPRGGGAVPRPSAPRGLSSRYSVASLRKQSRKRWCDNDRRFLALQTGHPSESESEERFLDSKTDKSNPYTPVHGPYRRTVRGTGVRAPCAPPSSKSPFFRARVRCTEGHGHGSTFSSFECRLSFFFFSFRPVVIIVVVIVVVRSEVDRRSAQKATPRWRRQGRVFRRGCASARTFRRHPGQGEVRRRTSRFPV